MPPKLNSRSVDLPRLRAIPDAEQAHVAILRAKAPRGTVLEGDWDPTEPDVVAVTLPIRCRLRGGRTWITGVGDEAGAKRVRRDAALIRGLQQAHRAMAELGWSKSDGAIADGRTMKAPENAYDRKLARLAFLAPDIQKRILEGRQPAGMTLDMLLSQPL